MTEMQQVRLGILKWVAKILFIMSVTTLAWFNVAVAVIYICTVILTFLVGKLEFLVELSFGPLKAKIEKNLTESEHLLVRLNTFATVQARAAISASVATGRFATGDDWIFQSVKRVEDGLRELGVSELQLIDVRADFVRLSIRDAAFAALGGSFMPMHWEKDALAELVQLRDENRFDPDKVEQCIRKWDQADPERLKRVEHMRWMIEHDDVRDRDQYMRAHNAVAWR